MKKKIGVTIGTVVGAAVLGLGIYHSNASQIDPDLSTDEIRDMVKEQYPGTITELELDKNGNRSVYEVEILGDEKKYELKLNGNTGEVIKLEEKKFSNSNKSDSVTESQLGDDTNNSKNDDDQSNNNNKEQSNKKSVIDSKEAEKIALKEIEGKITSIDLDEDDGSLVWEIEVHSNKKEAEFEIDAYTGEIIVMSIDEDSDDDDNDDD